MKISIAHDVLVTHLGVVARIASTRSAIQALSGVQIAATESAVELRATDMEIALRAPLPAEVQRPGEVVLPARLLLEVVAPASGPDREHRAAAGAAGRGARRRQRDVSPANASRRGLPDAARARRDTTVVVPAAAFTETIARVSRSASRDETRPILTGVLVSAEASSLRMVATDSYRLTVEETTLETPLVDGFEANVLRVRSRSSAG